LVSWSDNLRWFVGGERHHLIRQLVIVKTTGKKMHFAFFVKQQAEKEEGKNLWTGMGDHSEVKLEWFQWRETKIVGGCLPALQNGEPEAEKGRLKVVEK